MRRFGITSAIDVRFHYSPRVIYVVAIDAGAMSFVLANDPKSTNRSAEPFATAGYAGRRRNIPRPVDVSFLVTQAYNDRRPSRMTLRQIRCDQIGHCGAAAHSHHGRAEGTKL